MNIFIEKSGNKKPEKAPQEKKPKKEKLNKKPVNKEPQEQELNTEKDEYKMPRVGLIKVLRIMLWVILIIFFIKGLFVSLRKDPTEEVNRTIMEFRQELNDYQAQESGALFFAQNFAREYLTYTAKNEADFLKRITPYVSQHVLRNSFSFSNSAEVVYVQAYKSQPYSRSQTDVYVLADVNYLNKKGAQENQAPEQVNEQIVLKIPVACVDERYIIEDLPVFVNDDVKIAQYADAGVGGTDIGSDETNIIKKSLSNFFKSYYEDEQSVINYYLTKDAKPSDFIGLSGRVKYGEIRNIKCYSIVDNPEITCIITVTAVDKNGVSMPQNYNLRLIKQDAMYYIKSMATRTTNLVAASGAAG